MSWGIRIFALMILGMLCWLLLKPPSRLPASSAPESTPTALPAITAPTVASLNATAPVRVTVYQETAAGVPSFSDRADRGQPHVIDHSKGNTYQSTYHGEVPNTASATYTPSTIARIDPVTHLRQDNARFQQQVQAVRQQQVQAAIGE